MIVESTGQIQVDPPDTPRIVSAVLEQEYLQNIDSVFRSINQAIWIVTTQTNDQRSGLTATWIHQASVDRENPTVLIGLAPNHFTCEILKESKACLIHLLFPDQAELAYEFARPSSRARDKFESVEFDSVCISPEDGGHFLPWIPRCHSAFACQTLSSFPAGDRVYFLSKIINVVASSSDSFLREGEFFAGLTSNQVANLKSDLEEDVAIQRPMMADWLKKLNKSNSKN